MRLRFLGSLRLHDASTPNCTYTFCTRTLPSAYSNAVRKSQQTHRHHYHNPFALHTLGAWPSLRVEYGSRGTCVDVCAVRYMNLAYTSAAVAVVASARPCLLYDPKGTPLPRGAAGSTVSATVTHTRRATHAADITCCEEARTH